MLPFVSSKTLILKLASRPESRIILFILFIIEELPLFSNPIGGGVQKKLKVIKRIKNILSLSKGTTKYN